MTDDTPRKLVAQLQSKEGKDRQEALRAVYPGQLALLITSSPAGEIRWEGTPQTLPEQERLFFALLLCAQDVGRALGLDLNWVRTQQGPPGPQLLVPRHMR